MSSAFASPSGLSARGRSLTVALLLACLLPAFVVRRAARAYADALGDRIASFLSAVVPMAVQPLDPGVDEFVDGNERGDGEPPFANVSSVHGSIELDAKRPRQSSSARVARAHGIYVTSAQVLALAARRAMPSAVFVKGNAQHPAGLQLSGVSALGIGMQDGDVLTEAAGQKASSVAAVVGLVLAARARQATEISGRFYRAGVPFSLTVEQPYPKSPLPG